MNTKLKQRTDKGASVSKRNIRPGVRILHIIKNTFILLLVIAAVSMMVFTIVSVTTFDRNDMQAWLLQSIRNYYLQSQRQTDFVELVTDLNFNLMDS